MKLKDIKQELLNDLKSKGIYIGANYIRFERASNKTIHVIAPAVIHFHLTPLLVDRVAYGRKLVLLY